MIPSSRSWDYGSIVPWVTRLEERTLRAIAGPDMVLLRSAVDVRGEDLKTVGEFTVASGQTLPFTLTYAPSHLPAPEALVAAAALDDTCAQPPATSIRSRMCKSSTGMAGAIAGTTTAGMALASTGAVMPGVMGSVGVAAGAGMGGMAGIGASATSTASVAKAASIRERREYRERREGGERHEFRGERRDQGGEHREYRAPRESGGSQPSGGGQPSGGPKPSGGGTEWRRPQRILTCSGPLAHSGRPLSSATWKAPALDRGSQAGAVLLYP